MTWSGHIKWRDSEYTDRKMMEVEYFWMWWKDIQLVGMTEENGNKLSAVMTPKVKRKKNVTTF